MYILETGSKPWEAFTRIASQRREHKLGSYEVGSVCKPKQFRISVFRSLKVKAKLLATVNAGLCRVNRVGCSLQQMPGQTSDKSRGKKKDSLGLDRNGRGHLRGDNRRGKGLCRICMLIWTCSWRNLSYIWARQEMNVFSCFSSRTSKT